MDVLEISDRLVALRFSEINNLNAYLWRDHDGLTLIDAGLPDAGRDIAAAITRLGDDPTAVKRVILTHAHADHVGDTAWIRSWGPATVAAGAADAPIIRGLEPIPTPALRDWERPYWDALPPGAHEFHPSIVDIALSDGDEVDGARIIAVPGHTPGSIAVHLPEHCTLLVGDTIANIDGRLVDGAFHVDGAEVINSIKRLARLDIDLIGFGHGEPLTSDATVRLRELAAEL